MRQFITSAIRNFKQIPEGELINSVVSFIEYGIAVLAAVAAGASFVAGFFKPHAFIMAVLFLCVDALVISNIKEREGEE